VPIPDFQSIMRPLLQFASDGEEHPFRAAVDHIAQHFQVPDEERGQRLSGGSPILHNRAGWARTHFANAGLLEAPRRGVFRITERGRAALASSDVINLRYLRQFPEFIAFVKGGGDDPAGADAGGLGEAVQRPEPTPEEMIDGGYERHNAALVEELRERLSACSPSFFERLVVDLLVKMGYGGSLNDAKSAIGAKR
jgi:restriction system protein